MRLLSETILLLQLGAASATYTLSEVQAQISSHVNGKSQDSKSTTSSSTLGCHVACGFLTALSPHLSYPGSPSYNLQESQYWSQQQALIKPACRFSPSSAEEVSLAVLTSRVTRCKIAVKSGGHAAFSGASNIDGGLTLDLKNLNQVSVSEDKTQTAVGAGNVWYDVYTHLQPMNLTVIGGRVSAIGVGGLTLGGGMSFFSGRHGWACDNVITYEVVFADGSIRQVSRNSPYSDLYWALRGGGNNFGIVTRFDLATYPQGNLWAGSQTFLYSKDTAAAINNAFYHLAINSPSDPYAQIITAYAYAQSLDTYVIASDLQYGKPIANPPILQNFTSIPGPVRDTLRVTDLLDLTVEFNSTNPGGFRQSYWTLTFGNSASLMTDIVGIFMEEFDKVKDAAAIVPAISFQPITTDMIKHFSSNGGNALGLANKGPLNLINISVSWSNASDDKRILAAAKNTVDRSAAAAKAQGLEEKFLYQNYAAKQQDVFASYGDHSLARLRAISDKYDPEKVWQKLQPGYFKLW